MKKSDDKKYIINLIDFIVFMVLIYFMLYNYVKCAGSKAFVQEAMNAPVVNSVEYIMDAVTKQERDNIIDKLRNSEKVKSINIKKLSCVNITDTKNCGYLERNIKCLQYDEMIEKYIICGNNELKKGEVIIPKYYKPGDGEKYKNTGYMDGEELVGTTIDYTFHIDEFDYEKEGMTEEISLKVVGVYDNIKAGISGEQIFVMEDTLRQWYTEILGKDNYDSLADRVLVYYDSDKLIEDYHKEIYDIAGVEDSVDIAVTSSYQENSEVLLSDMIYQENIYQDEYKDIVKATIVIGIIMFCLRVVYSIIRKKGFRDIMIVSISVFAAYIVASIAMIKVFIEHNNEVKELLNVGRYITYGYDKGFWLIGLVLLGLTVLMASIGKIFEKRGKKHEYN